MKIYSDSFKRNVVSFNKKNTNKATVEKYGVSIISIYRWKDAIKNSNFKVNFKLDSLEEKSYEKMSKEEIVSLLEFILKYKNKVEEENKKCQKYIK